MELKSQKESGVTVITGLLIVPYGIEILFELCKVIKYFALNRTLWN